MARDPKQLRKAYEYKLGKDLVSKLDDKQISSLSKYYNSLPPDQQSKVDSELIKGMGEFLDTARMMAGMQETELKGDKKFTPNAKPKPQGPMRPPKEKGGDVYSARKSDKEIEEDIPEGLDDLLKDIKTETSKPKTTSKKPDKKAVTAIVKKFSTEKKEDTKQQTTNETIDPKILKILGLEDVSDFDYGEYKTLLREKMAADRMGQKVDSGDAELISDEYKRVKGKTGKFTQKKKSVNISKVVQSGKKYNKSSINAQKLLSGSKKEESTKTQAKGEAVTNSFENINRSLLGIDSLLKGILGEEKKESEQEAKTARKSAQKAEEEKSEKTAKKKATSALKGFKAPKMGFLDMIKNFFKNILLGGFILKALDWFQDEENQKKIQNVITFITDNLDKILLGIAALVGIGIGAKILGFLKLFSPLIKGVLFVLKGFLGIIPKIINKFKPPKNTPTPKNTPNTGNQNKPRQGTGKNAGRTSGKGTGKPGQNITQGGGSNTGGGRVTGSGGRTVQPGRRAPRTGGGRGIGGTIRGGILGAIGFTALDYFMPQIQDFVSGIAGNFGMGPRAATDADIIKSLEKAEKDIAQLTEQMGADNPALPRTTSMIADEAAMYLREAQRRGLVEISEDKQSYTYTEKATTSETSSARDSLSDEDKKVTPGSLPPSVATPSEATPEVTPQTSLLGKQSSAPTADYGAGSDGGPKGYIIVPGHAAGLGAPGEMEITPQLADNLVTNLRKRVGPDVPVKVVNMHAETELTQAAFTKQQDRLKAFEDQGYEVIELHMDASVESGASPGGGRGVILPMPGTDAINPVEADFAKTSGAFPREHRGGLAGTNRGASLIELGNMSPALQKSALSGEVPKSDLDLLTKPLEDSFIRVLGLPEVKPKPKVDPPKPPGDQASAIVAPLGGGGSGDTQLASASGGRATAASFSSTDSTNVNTILTGSLFNLTTV